jgi:CheY-like chemotaxis protein
MPGMDGCTVASKIRQDAQNRDMLLIALTGFGQDEDRSRSSVVGFDEHLTKPADLNLLQKLIARNVAAAAYQQGTSSRPT